MEPPQLYEEEKGSKVFLDAEFPVPVDTLFSLLFLPSSPFWVAFMNIRKTKSWTCQDWKNEADKITREAKCLQVSQYILILYIILYSTFKCQWAQKMSLKSIITL